MGKHKHAELIKAWADGVVIQVQNSDGCWRDAVEPIWKEYFLFRIKPAVPKWPYTTMTEEDIVSAYYGGGPVNDYQEETKAFFRVANAALAHALETGLVVLP